MSEAFDHIPFEDLVQPFAMLGSGSFGSVFKSTYLGLPVALKQIHPSKDYDVQKYFEREWRLMRETRHPNVVLYLGLSKSPEGLIYIVSEYVEGGNLRAYIHDRRKPFPWAMRVSFCVDIARALAYLHARKCIHRDLKPENLLLTSNSRIKITDFGFARIAPRNNEEERRLTYCGTDAYMSPEILLGSPFGIETDLFSLGVIFCEILSRTLADDKHFRRSAPFWAVDSEEVKKSANDGCPDDLISLANDCMQGTPSGRPKMTDVLARLTAIETEVASRVSEMGAEGSTHVGTVKFATGGRRPKLAPRIPSFNGQLQLDTTRNGHAVVKEEEETGDTEEDELEAALKALELTLGVDAETAAAATTPPATGHENEPSYSTTVIKPHHRQGTSNHDMSSILTIRASPSPPTDTLGHTDTIASITAIRAPSPPLSHHSRFSAMSVDSYHTAIPDESKFSVAAATIGAESTRDTIRSLPDVVRSPRRVVYDFDEPFASSSSATPRVHRFTMIKGSKVGRWSLQPSPTATVGESPKKKGSEGLGWSPIDYLWLKAFAPLKGRSGGSPYASPSASPPPPATKCDLCGKKLGLGYKTTLECDDCGLRVHIKCGEFAPRDCGMRHLDVPGAFPSNETSAPPQEAEQSESTTSSPSPRKLSKDKRFSLR